MRSSWSAKSPRVRDGDARRPPRATRHPYPNQKGSQPEARPRDTTTSPVTNPRGGGRQQAAAAAPATGRERVSARAAMERRGQQPEDAEPPGKDGPSGAPAPPPSPFLEVTCRSSGKVRRFAAGTTARYALHAINRKLDPGAPPALHVEAVRDGEEPVSFGPSAALADYGRGWRLQTVTAQDAPGIHHATRDDTKRGETQAAEDAVARETTRSTSVYIAKIVLAFVFIFLLGGLFTYMLEVLPDMLQTSPTPESL
ncbi:hypothetical protein SEVIR_9G090700v4 [Setaria viridis]|uniref:Uncharacterized protein n=1 Tax=Setaria viridis TaxID=4556 RepID=A0A4U6SS61_SETVI|nr:hypothetical protein SEVIR_9G090700v2 [Setaria viridis]